MKITLMSILLSITTAASFVTTYFFSLTMNYGDQYLALVAVVMLDGFFGIIAGAKREGFQTCKAIKVLRTLVTWIIFLTTLLIIEKGFPATAWLSETILLPFIIFQVMSALKNASNAGFIKAEILNRILEKFDKHKDQL